MKFYTHGGGSTTIIYEHECSTAWDLSTASYSTRSWTVTTQWTGYSVAFSTDGSKMFIADEVNERIRQYTLSTPWLITSASTDVSNYLVHGINQIRSLTLSADGTKMFLGSYIGNNVYQFNLPSAFDVGTVTTQRTPDRTQSIDGVLAGSGNRIWGLAFGSDGTKLMVLNQSNQTVQRFTSTTTSTGYGTSETWVNSTTNNELAALQQALGAQAFNRMDKAQLQAVSDANQYTLGNTLDLMIAPYATSGISPISDGVTVGYQAEALIRQAINGTDYEAEFPTTNKVKIKSLAGQNLKIRII